MSVFKKKHVIKFSQIISELNEAVMLSGDADLMRLWNQFLTNLVEFQKKIDKKE